MKILEYLHAALLAMPVAPLLYALAELTETGGTAMFYIKCFLIIFPIAATEIAVRKIRNLGGYLLVGLVATAALYGIIRLFFAGSGLCYTVVILAESLLVVFLRLLERVRLALQEKENDIYAAPAVSLLNKPSLGFLWYFTVMYLLGIVFNASALCDIAFVNAVIYFFAALAHAYLTETEHYLNMNRRTRSIPKRRLYAVSAAMTGAFAGLVLLAMLPSMLLAGQRRYTDIRTWFDDVEPVPYTMEYELQPYEDGGLGTDWFAVMEDGEPAPEPSKFWEGLLWAFLAVFAVGAVYAAFRLIRQFFLDFRNSFDENGDRVEELDDDPADKEEGLARRRRRDRADSETARVRRLYKKTIRRHRREIPAPYESPTELEEKAGLAGDEAMGALHVQYENVRYGRG